MVRILLVDDHPVVRHGIRQILVDGLKGVSVGEAGDVASASASIRAAAWDVVVLDVTLPGASGLDLLKEIRDRVTNVLERVGLGHRAKHFPNELSGGEMQRVAIARALANRPRLLLADEPTGELDQTTGQQIVGLIDRLHADGMAVVVVTHDPAVAARAARLVRMRDGRIVDDVAP